MRVAGLVLVVVFVCTATGRLLASPPVLQVGGEPYFPLGWYDSRGFGSSVGAATAAYAEYPSAGMNTVLFAYGSWSNQGPSITSALEGASANGLKLMVEIDRNAVQQQPGYPFSLIDEQVDLMKSDPALLGYYLMDEPEIQGVSVSMLQDRYAQIKARDPVHPIFVVHHHTTSYLSSEPPPYTDVLMSDTYVVRKGRPEFADDLWTVAQHARIQAQQAESHGKQAYVNVVQTHDTTNETGFRPPTFAEQRYISYAPIVQGARGLLYWMHYYTTQDYRTNVVGPIASEIESLVPAIISNSTAVSVSSNLDGQSTHSGVGDISYLFGQDETGGYLLAVNNTASALSVQFTLEGASLLDLAPVLWESRMVTLQDLGGDTSIFTDSFGPFDVNVYRIAVPEPATGTLFMVLLGMGLFTRRAGATAGLPSSVWAVYFCGMNPAKRPHRKRV